jgi:glycosyltransferase involved in cell wall biosynthesis
MKILVGICTYNRAASLRITLERLKDIHKPIRADLAIVVVNNNSRDITDHIVRSFMADLPLSLVQEPAIGLSNARNAVVRHAVSLQADYIVFTDDDILPSENWLRLYEDAFERHPEASVFGGSIEPWYESDPPRWMQNAWPVIRAAYGIHDDGRVEEQLTHTGSKTPFGANYAIRTKEHTPMRYDTALGVRGKVRIGGEETAMIRRILASGATGWWVAGATVRHFIPKDKMSLLFLAKYYRGQGITMSLLSGQPNGSKWAKRWAVRATVDHLLRFLIYSVQGRSELAMQHYCEAFIAYGQFDA